jgi:cellulose synthase/poly-beta-1,6-N-acetylglucosamine synthase-like glycosyltransferase
VAVPVGYLTVLTGAAWIVTLVPSRRRTPERAEPLRMAVVVPAHDEAAVIGATLAAMAALDYPAGRARVHVVADHCTDDTVAIARAAGVTVHEHVGVGRGKGTALQWAIERILADTDPPDVVVIVDADTIVAPGMLRALDRRVSGGAAVVQGQYRVREPGSSPSAGLRAAALALRHHLRPLGRTALGASSGLYGNGMAFRVDVLRGRSWTSHLTEDLELQMELLFDGIRVEYEPAAVVESEMPATLEGSTTQNERWERGRLELARRYVPALLRAALGRHREAGPSRVAAADGALDHVVPPLSVLVALTGGVAVAGSAVGMARRAGPRPAGWALVTLLVVHVASGLVLARVPRSVYRSLVRAPELVLWKVRLWVRMLVRRDEVDWVRTARAEP